MRPCRKFRPSKTVRLIEPFGAGGGPDLLGHALAQKLAKLWRHSTPMGDW